MERQHPQTKIHVKLMFQLINFKMGKSQVQTALLLSLMVMHMNLLHRSTLPIWRGYLFNSCASPLRKIEGMFVWKAIWSLCGKQGNYCPLLQEYRRSLPQSMM